MTNETRTPERTGAGASPEAIARIIDPEAWAWPWPTNGLGQHWPSRRRRALAKADAIIALLPK